MNSEVAAILTSMLIELFSGTRERMEADKAEEYFRCLELADYGGAIMAQKNAGTPMHEVLREIKEAGIHEEMEGNVLELVPIAYEQEVDFSVEDFRDTVAATCNTSIENK